MIDLRRRMGARLRAPSAHQGFKANLNAAARAQLPEAVDQTKAFDVITQQGDMGSCLLNAGAEAAHQRMKAQGLGDWSPARLPLYRLCLEKDGAYPSDEGTFPETVIAVMGESGFAPETLAPYDDRPAALRRKISPAYAAEAARWRVTGSMAIERDRETLMSELAAANPVIISMQLHESFQDVRADGIMPIPKRSEAELGGHGMRLVGYDPTFVLCANSWGREFGRNGYVLIPWPLVLDTYTTRSLHSIQTVQHR